MDLVDVLGGDFIPDRYISKKAYTTSDPPRIGAYNKMLEYGMKPPPALPVNQLIRFPDAHNLANGKPNGRDGWAIYFEYTADDDTIGICVFGSWHGEPDQFIWASKHETAMTGRELKEYHDRIAAARAEQEVLKYKRQEIAKEECAGIFKGLQPISGNDYTRKKGFKPVQGYDRNGVIVVPIYHNDELCSLQYISPDGSKKFHTGGRIKGGYLKLEGTDRSKLFICEGWSTGCSILEATNCTVYVAFNAGNLYEVCQHVKNTESGYICIAADDDYETEKNTGLDAAQNCADVFGFDIKAPVFTSEKRGTDFNDMAQIEGLEAVKAHLAIQLGKVVKQESQEQAKEQDIKVPPGVIEDIYNYYMATSGNNQPGFALQTALALCSVALGRYFITDEDNLAALYFLNVGKSATGKEHCKKVIERIMHSVGWESRVAGAGFTSGAGVMSLLLHKTVCITVIDEFGKYLEAAANTKGSLQSEANTMLMEAIGRLSDVLRPKNYSMMTVPKDQAKDLRDRYVMYPSLTLIGLTTPNTFYDQLKLSSVLDGFLNRFIVFVSDEPMARRKRTKMFDPPDSVISWFRKVQSIIEMLNPVEVANEYPNTVEVQFSKEAIEVKNKFEDEMIALREKLEKVRLEALPGRAHEWAQRLALILCLSRSPANKYISGEDMQWACDYMRASTHKLLQEVKDNVSDSYIEAGRKAVLLAIRDRKEHGVKWSEMTLLPPFCNYPTRELKEHLAALVDGDYLICTSEKSGRGRPTPQYIATEHFQQELNEM